MSENWYLRAADYYFKIRPGEENQYPPRLGDLFGPIESNGKQWHGAQLIHPTCELTKPRVKQVQVIRTRLFSEIVDSRARAAVMAGWKEKNGVTQIAFANTFFLDPLTNQMNQPLFSNFREMATVEKDTLLS